MRYELVPERDVLRVARVEFCRLLAACIHNVAAGFVFIADNFRQIANVYVEPRQFANGVGGVRGIVAVVLVTVDENAELRAPVAEVVVADHGMPEEPQDSYERVADDRASQVPDM